MKRVTSNIYSINGYSIFMTFSDYQQGYQQGFEVFLTYEKSSEHENYLVI